MDVSWTLGKELCCHSYNATWERKKNLFFSPSKEEGGITLDQKVNLFNE